MRKLLATEVLEVWENGLAQASVQQALMLLAAACPETTYDALAELSVGQRDAQLLILRQWTFGPHLVSQAICPGCQELLELNFSVADVCVEPRVEPSEVLSLDVSGYQIKFRLPNSHDLAAIQEIHDDVAARELLITRCLRAARLNAEEISIDRMPPEVVDAMVNKMAEIDPQGDVQLRLTCIACGHEWQEIFDIATYFWIEIHSWALRTLREVHVLASAYGWRETDILAMSPWRRQLYLDLIGK